MPRGQPKGGKLVRWDTYETEQLVKTAAEFRREGHGLATSLRKANEKMPEGRRRPDNSLYAAHKRLFPKIEAAVQEALARERSAEVTSAVAATTPQAPEPLQVDAQAPVIDALRPLVEAFAAAFAREAAPIMAKALLDATTRLHLTMQAAPQNRGTAAAIQESDDHELHDYGKLPKKFHKHKVAVLGLLGAQQREVQRRFPNLDFRFIDGNANSSRVENVTRSVECTFSMIKFVRHHADGGAKVHGQYVPVNGGLSELYRTLSARFPANHSMEPLHQ